MRKIVVGMDGSDGARTALHWAAHEAKMHEASLTVLLAWNLLGQPGDDFSPTFDQDDALAALEGWLADLWLSPGVDVKPEVVCDLAASALVEASSDADLVVVGSRGLGGFKELLLGSVSAAVAERASAPVAVVRDTGMLGGRVVVGVDGSTHSLRALRWAAEEARVRQTPLEVVHAWAGSASPVFGIPFAVPTQHAETAAEHALTKAIESVDLSGLIVHRRAAEGTAAGVLVEMSSSAAVVVVGSRGRGGLTSILLGSTSRSLLHHAVCPVVVIR